MTLLETIKKKAANYSKEALLKKMGYRNMKAGEKRLDSLLRADDLYIWLKIGGFDMKYSSEEFLCKLAEILEILDEMHKDIARYQKRLDEISKMKQPYIFIDTYFVRKNEPIFSLGFMESSRNIGIDKEHLVFKGLDKVLEYIGDMISTHYVQSGGILSLWGKIYNYVYHHTDGGRYIFDTDGRLNEDTEEIIESKAELKIGNKEITNLTGG